MVIPYSLCGIERIFFKCTNIKTLKRNRLSVKSLEACLLVKQQYGEKNFQFPEEVFNMFLMDRKIETPLRKETKDQLKSTEQTNLNQIQESLVHKMEVEENIETLNNGLIDIQNPLSQIGESFIKATASGFENFFKISVMMPLIE